MAAGVSSLRGAVRRILPHPDARRFALTPGAEPAGLYIDERRGLLAVNELGTRRITILDSHSGEILNQIPLGATVDIDLREQTIGGALLVGPRGAAYLWSTRAGSQVRRLVLDNGPPRIEGNAFVGGGLLRDWLYDANSGRVALTTLDDRHLYLVDAELQSIRFLPLEAPPGHLAAMAGARALVLLDSPEERACLVDLVNGWVLNSASPWSELNDFPNPPCQGPFLNSAPLVIAPDGSRAFVGSHRTDGINQTSPLVALRLPNLVVDAFLVDSRLTTPTRLATHPAGQELYVSGFGATLVVDPSRMEVIGELGPGRLTALEVSPSGRAGVAVDMGNTTAFLFDGAAGRTLTAPLTPDTDPSELLSVPVLVSEVLGAAYVADRFGSSVLVLPLI